MANYRHVEDEPVDAARVSPEFATELRLLLATRTGVTHADLSDATLFEYNLDRLLAAHAGEWVVRDSTGDLYTMSHTAFQESYIPAPELANVSLVCDQSFSLETLAIALRE